jgi:hypothetical protein
VTALLCLLQAILRNLGADRGLWDILERRGDYGVCSNLDDVGRTTYGFDKWNECSGTLKVEKAGNIPLASSIAAEVARAAGGETALRTCCSMTANLRLNGQGALDGDLVDGETPEGVYSRAQHKARSDRNRPSSGLSSTKGACIF